jgi:hypothetical protein
MGKIEVIHSQALPLAQASFKRVWQGGFLRGLFQPGIAHQLRGSVGGKPVAPNTIDRNFSRFKEQGGGQG